MRRRDFIRLVAGSATGWPLGAGAQQVSTKVFRIGYLSSVSADGLPKRMQAFRAALRDLGYQEERDLIIEYRWADGKYERLPDLLADLVRLKVDVIVTHGTPGVLAAKQATTSIPIVAAVVGDALGSGVVSSLARPGGNVTGLTFFNPELAAKRLELLKEIMPNLMRVGVLLNLVNPMNGPTLPQMRGVAEPLKLELEQFDVRTAADFEGAFAAMMAKRIGALVVIDDAVLLANASKAAALALEHRLPSCGWPDFAIAGGMLAYGVDFVDMYRRAATYVDKILKGAKPGELPVERSTKFETVVNLKTAKELGLEIPYNFLAHADEVIE